MIDIEQLKQPDGVVNVEPCDRIFDELGNNTYDFKDLISELIDNSIAARRADKKLKVNVEIEVDERNNVKGITVKDNALGIPKDKLGLAISPAGIQTHGSLNEHGLGMKQAIAGLGKLKYIATKTIEETKARVILRFGFGQIDFLNSGFDQDSGTEICIIETKPIVNANPQSITMTLIPYLGARYRRFLKPDNKIIY